MSKLTIGSTSSDHVSIQLPATTEVQDEWFTSTVEIVVGGFSANTSVHFELVDFVHSLDSLEILYHDLSGGAHLTPREAQITLALHGNGRGAIEVSGCLYQHATFGSRLEYEFSIDQTFLVQPSRVLKTWLDEQQSN